MVLEDLGVEKLGEVCRRRRAFTRYETCALGELAHHHECRVETRGVGLELDQVEAYPIPVKRPVRSAP